MLYYVGVRPGVQTGCVGYEEQIDDESELHGDPFILHAAYQRERLSRHLSDPSVHPS